MKRILRSGAVPPALLLSAILSGAGTQPPPAGTILEKVGSWRLSGSSGQLFPGSSVPVGGILQNASPSDDDHIIVQNAEWKIISNIHCRDGHCCEYGVSGSCDGPIRPLKAQAPAAPAAAYLEAIKEIFFGKPDTYSIHQVRSFRPDLKEAVLPLKDGNFDIGAVFAGQEKRSTYVRLQTILSPSSHGEPWESQPVPVDWDPSHKTAPLAIKDIHPGIYRLIVLRKSGNDFVTSDGDAWILLSSEAVYPAQNSFFQETAGRVVLWGPDISPVIARGYLRATLEYLAAHPAKNARRKDASHEK